MNTPNSTVLLDNYLGLLKGLTREDKIKLVARLSRDIVETTDERKENVVDMFYGAWKSDRSAEEIIATIRNSRDFTRTVARL
ncbi:MAG: hypothetical protein LBP56_00070 [Odoribacteraceae bacterium]|jgi:hypothetical protein|nr:hypothetical protein [Odoribacteraceae bacterium]